MNAPKAQANLPPLESTGLGWADERQSADFDYSPVSPWGMVALAIGMTGLSAFLGVYGIGIAFMGVVVGLAAMVQIRGAHGMVRGMAVAVAGFAISTVCLGGGIASQIYHYRTECPEGYLRVNFPQEISERQFVYYGTQKRLHPEVAPLIEQKIFIKGFMWTTQQDTDLTRFILLKDNGECCFGGSPQPYDMMQVEMVDGTTVDGHTGLVSVAGVLRANIAAGKDEAVYLVDAHTVEPSKTRF